MKGLTAVRTVSLTAVLVLVLAACGADALSGPPTEPPPVVAVVTVTAPVAALPVGQQATFVAVPKSADGAALDRPVTWHSLQAQYATVDAAGTVTAVAPGAATIVATSEGKSGSAVLTVVAVAPPPPVPVAFVRLSVDDEVRLAWNGTAQLAAVALDADSNALAGRAITWHTTKPGVVTVSDQGRLEAVAPGVAIVSAISEGVAASVGVRVLQAPVTQVLLDVGSTGLETGETMLIGARLRLASGEVVTGSVAWTSSAAAVATVTASDLALGAVQALDTGAVTITATADGVSASVALRITPPPTHDLIYHRETGTQAEIMVLRLTAGGQPERLNAGTVSRDPSPSPDGTRFVFAVSQMDPFGNRVDDLFIVNRNGLNVQWLTRTAGVEDQPAWSPDGSRILFHTTGSAGTPDLWVINVDGTGLVNLTAGLPADVTDRRQPAWSPDGRRIAFIGARNGQHKVWVMNADGTGAAPLTTDAGFDTSPAWSPDGARIAFTRYDAANPANGWDVMIVAAAGGAPVRLSLPGDQLTPAWSPDGHTIAVAGTVVAGRSPVDLYTLRPDGSGLRLRTVNPAWGGGLSPAWITRQ